MKNKNQTIWETQIKKWKKMSKDNWSEKERKWSERDKLNFNLNKKR